MKIMMLLALVISLNANAQITLEKSFLNKSIATYGDNSAFALFDDNNIEIYGYDFKLIKKSTPSKQADFKIASVQLVTRHIFNEDDLYEFVVIFSGNNTNTVSIINQDGTVIKNLGDKNYITTQLLHTTEGNKLLCLEYKNATYNYDFYSLPSTEPITEVSIQTEAIKILPYPNPSFGIFKIPNVNHETIMVYDINGKFVDAFNDETIDLSGFDKGIYLLKSEKQTYKLELK